MAGLENFDCEGTLTIDTFSMNRAAWAVLANESGQNGLLQVVMFQEFRGEDRIIPGAAGTIAYPRRATVTRYDFRLIVTGDVDGNGTAATSPKATLIDNIQAIRTAIEGGDASTGTREFIFTLPGSNVLTGEAHVLGLTPVAYYLDEEDRAAIAELTLQTSFPYGAPT